MPASPDSTSPETKVSDFTQVSSRLDVAVVDNWLIFDCPDCAQTIKIDKEDCMYDIECPSCHSGFEPLLARDTALPAPKDTTPRKRGRRRARPRVPGAAAAESIAPSVPSAKPPSSSKPTTASLPAEGKVRLIIKQTRSNGEAAKDDEVLPVRSALDLERRRVEATVDTRLHENKGDSELDAVIEEESGGRYKRIRVRTRKKRSTEKEKTQRFYLYAGLAGIVIMGLCLFSASRMFLSDDPSSDGDEVVLSSFTDADPIGSMIGNANVLMNEFIAVDSIDKLLKVIRKPKRLEETIREFYGEGRFPRYNVISLVPDSKNTELLPKNFSRFRMTLGSNIIPLYIEKTETHGYRLDWESLVGHGSMPWSSFVNNKSTRVSTMRVYLSDADYYEKPFSDRRRYAVVKLEDPTRKYIVYGYFLKADLKLKNLYNQVQNAIAANTKFEQPMMMKIRYPAGAENTAQVEVVEAIDDTWLRP